jgi:Leucine-rich repeat (LRR) protein
LTSLPIEITNIPKIRSIEVEYNKLNTLPKEVEKLQKLEFLLLEGNDILEGEKKRLKKKLPNCIISF